ncbi:MAG: hypothetical protein ABIJ56_11275, partial [Pseudomonadota bacterium]
ISNIMFTKLLLGAEAPGWQGAGSPSRRRHSRSMSTSDGVQQRSQPGWIGVQKWEVVFSRALSPMSRPLPIVCLNIVAALLVFRAAGIAPAGAAPPEDEGTVLDGDDETCTALPPTTWFNPGTAGTVTGLGIAAGCGGEGVHAFIHEILPADGTGEKELHIRFAPALPGGKLLKSSWMAKKLLRIKNASTAAGLSLKGKNTWVVTYAKALDDGRVAPTIAVITAVEDNKSIKTRIFKFPAQEHFFSPFLFDRAGRAMAVWGEGPVGKLSVVYAVVDPGKMEVSEKKQLASGDMADRFYVFSKPDMILLARLKDSAKEPGCSDVWVSRFSGAGEPEAELNAATFCNELKITGLQFIDAKTVVEGLEARKGMWKGVMVSVSPDFGSAEIKRSKSPVFSFDSSFVRISMLALWKDSQALPNLQFKIFDNDFMVTQEAVEVPLALSLCQSTIVGGWVEEPEGGGAIIKYFDIAMTDGDGDGVLDAFDLCLGK